MHPYDSSSHREEFDHLFLLQRSITTDNELASETIDEHASFEYSTESLDEVLPSLLNFEFKETDR